MKYWQGRIKQGMEISIGLESSEKILILRMHLSLNFNAKILAAAQLWKLDVLAGVACGGGELLLRVSSMDCSFAEWSPLGPMVAGQRI